MRKKKLMEENSIFIFQESLVRGGKASSVTVAPTRKKPALHEFHATGDGSCVSWS
jgi:hypothetical protein